MACVCYAFCFCIVTLFFQQLKFSGIKISEGQNPKIKGNAPSVNITGGGSCLVKNFYKFNSDRTVFVEDICAAAKGYEYLAEIQLSAGKSV